MPEGYGLRPDRMIMERISVIIPVRGEEGRIKKTLHDLRACDGGDQVEIIVVDGDEKGTTCRVINDSDVVALRAPRGRGRQMNAGATVAHGDILVFLHADTRLPRDAFESVRRVFRDTECAAGAFDLTIDAPGILFRIIERAATIRSRVTRIPYGDQCHVVRRTVFEQMSGYRDIPIMEDVDFMRRVRKGDGLVAFFGERVITSARRWRKEGIIRCTLRNWFLMILYFMGARPERLSRFYS